MRDEAVAALRRFYEVIEQLRAPGGCPWDRQQTHQTLAPFLLEETYETLDAIAEAGPAELREELGDLLLQIAMHSVIASEQEGFDIGDVAEVITAKMIHRHPHVFGDATVAGADEVVVNWERLKAAEKKQRESLLDGVPTTLPALAYADAIQRRPARVGFDPLPTRADAVAAAETAIAAASALPEPRAAAADPGEWVATAGGFARAGESVPGDAVVAAPADAARLVGEYLFAAVALARRLSVDAEAALRETTRGFAERFRTMERQARDDGVDIHAIARDEWQRRWERAGTQSG